MRYAFSRGVEAEAWEKTLRKILIVLAGIAGLDAPSSAVFAAEPYQAEYKACERALVACIVKSRKGINDRREMCADRPCTDKCTEKFKVCMAGLPRRGSNPL